MRVAPFPLLLAAAAVTACSDRSPSPEGADETRPTAAVDGARSYRCTDGTMLQADYAGAGVTLRWADGRTLALPRAESASTPGADAFVGDTVSLQRSGAGIELHDGDKPTLACNEVHADDRDDAQARVEAAGNPGITMRYTCNADTQVTVLADGTARVNLPQGRIVVVSRVAGSAPPVFAGESLYFTVEEDGARLSQDGEARELTCVPA